MSLSAASCPKPSGAIISGNAAAREPAAPASAPIRLYRANILVRSRLVASRASTACSSGTKMLTLPADGLTVPANATTRRIA